MLGEIQMTIGIVGRPLFGKVCNGFWVIAQWNTDGTKTRVKSALFLGGLNLDQDVAGVSQTAHSDSEISLPMGISDLPGS